MEERILKRVYHFFIESDNYNGIPLKCILEESSMNFQDSINLVKELVEKKLILIQSGKNLNIIEFKHFSIENQIKILDKFLKLFFKSDKLEEKKFEIPELLICLYPSLDYLKSNRDINYLQTAEFSKLLAIGHPQNSLHFFEIEVLDRYINDTSYVIDFEDFAGSISVKVDEINKGNKKEETHFFLKSFGIATDNEKNRYIAVYLKFLKDLNLEHQLFWFNKEVHKSCKEIKEYHLKIIKDNLTPSHSVFFAIIGELKCLNDLSKITDEKNLFIKEFDKKDLPKSFSFFFSPTLNNYCEFLGFIDTIIFKNINIDFFLHDVDLYRYKETENSFHEAFQKTSLELLHEWLLRNWEDNEKPYIEIIIRLLEKIRSEINIPMYKYMENEYNKKYFEKQRLILEDTYIALRNLRRLFLGVPQTYFYSDFIWLEEDNILVY